MAAPHVRLASALRWRLPSAAAERDIVRVWVDGGPVVALANAYDSAFATCWLDGSRLLLDRFEEAWAAGSGPVLDRLHAAFARARAAFLAEAPALVAADDLGFDAPPAATLHAVALDGDVAHAAWIGGDVALVSRGFQAVAATTPHTLTEELRAAQGLPAPPPQLAGIVTRTIQADRHADPPSVARFTLAAGDTLIVAGRERPPTDELAVAAGGTLSPVALAEWIVAAGERRPFAAAAVVRVDGIDLAATIDAAVDGYVPGARRDAWLGAWARAERALPVWFDKGGMLAIRGDGSVLAVDRDRPARTRVESDPMWHRVVAVAAARHPALAALAPARPPGAAPCRVCALYTALAGAGCPGCQGLGWELPALPTWLRTPPLRTR